MPAADGFASYAGDGGAVTPQCRRGVHRPVGLVRLSRKLLPAELRVSAVWPALAVLGACLAWGMDNNLTRKVSLSDASWIAAGKGLVSGLISLGSAFALGVAHRPGLPDVSAAMLVGFAAYGVSLALFIVALRHLGTGRTGAYFSVAPFIGAVLAVALGEPIT